MPQPRWVKPALALASTLVCGVAVLLVLRARREPELLRLEQVTYDWGGVESGGVELEGVDPLEAGERARFPPSRLVRRPFTEKEAHELFFYSGQDSYDPIVGYRIARAFSNEQPFGDHPRGTIRQTRNSLGIRGAELPSKERPDLRVLVVGDSHTEGVVSDDETYSAVLEAALRARHPGKRIEVLNAARGGYSWLHYLGTLERLTPLEPDIVVVCLYGGNDFDEGLTLHHLFQGTARPSSEPFQIQRSKCAETHVCALGQGLASVKYFSYWQDQIDVALQAARDTCTEIQTHALRHGMLPVFVYLPPPHSIELEKHEGLPEACQVLEVTEKDLGITDRMGDSLLAALRQQGSTVVDLRPGFRAAEEMLYWPSDHHINVAAHARIAAELERAVDWDAWITRPVVRRIALAAVAKEAEDPAEANLHTRLFEAPTMARPAPLKPRERKPVSPTESKVAAALADWPQARFDARRWTSWTPKLEGTAFGPRGFEFELETNALACRVLPQQPLGDLDASVLVCGDENIACTATPGTGLAGALQREISTRLMKETVFCIDGSAPGQFPDAYLATVEDFANPGTAAVVVAFDPETDFEDTLRARRSAAPDEASGPRERRQGDGRRTIDREALRTALDVLIDLSDLCTQRGVAKLVVVVLPAATTRGSEAELELRLADELVAALRARSIRVADLARLAESGVHPHDPRTGLVTVEIQRLAAQAIAVELMPALSAATAGSER